MRIADDFDARVNGELVQITSKYLEAFGPELPPAVVAHELAHNILRHREQLAAAGAQFGLASGFGRNAGLFRQTEIEADIDARTRAIRTELAARFWREAGPKLMAGIIRSRSHPAIRDRGAIAEAEAAQIAAAGGAASLPPFYAKRDRSLNGNRQIIGGPRSNPDQLTKSRFYRDQRPLGCSLGGGCCCCIICM